MSVSISISECEQDVFWLNNDWFRRFSALLELQLENEAVKEQLHLAESFNGVCLEQLSKEKDELAIELAKAFLTGARSITSGESLETLFDESPQATPEDRESAKEHFLQLENLMLRFLTSQLSDGG